MNLALKTNSSRVEDFHTKYGFPIGEDLQLQKNADVQRSLTSAARSLGVIAMTLKYVGIYAPEGDHRAYRAHLMCEELGEALEALCGHDIIALADALADLKYTTIGTEITYGIPGEDILKEVHRSNMTRNPPTKDDPRMRKKGEQYEKPELKPILQEAGLLPEKPQCVSFPDIPDIGRD